MRACACVCLSEEDSEINCLAACDVLLGLARTIYIRCMYGIFGRENTEYTVIYGVYIRFWPTLRTLRSAS